MKDLAKNELNDLIKKNKKMKKIKNIFITKR